MQERSVKIETDTRGLATVTLGRPDKHNAFDDIVIAELHTAFEALAGRDEVRVVVLASEGRSFSAGADLNWMKRMAGYDYEQNLKDAEALAAMFKALYQLPQPSIARVQGAAFGGGMGLVSCCDIAVASEKANFALPEVGLGLIPATISPYVIRAIGERAARRYFVTGERFSAAEAHRLELVSEVVAETQLDAAVQELVTAILGNGPSAVRAAKELVKSMAGQAITPALIKDTSERIARVRGSAEGREGVSAFLEKHQPGWKGR